jgi:putative transposase
MEYRRRLPHFQPDCATLFITFRLYGTLPLHFGHDGRSFVTADRELERATLGPDWLKRPQIADCVTRVVLDGDRVRAWYNLIAFVVMPNHVHLLIEPKVPAPRITKYVKGVSAKEANALLGRTGQRFWQVESYDRWVRSVEERRNIIRYIEFNPVRANLAPEPRLFRYSSAFHLFSELRTG